MRFQYQHQFQLPMPRGETIRTAMEDLERRLIADALDFCQGNRSAAAKCLNMKRSTLMMALRRLGLTRPEGMKAN